MSKLKLTLDPIYVPGVMAAKLWIRDGSRYDPRGKKGAHQLLGSLLTRGCGPFNKFSLADIVEGCGAGLRCDTYEDGLLISLKCAACDRDKLLPLLGWMIIDPHIDNDELKLEKELSLQVLQRQKENPFNIAFDNWRHIAYKNGPYGHDPLGVKKDLESLMRKDLMPLANNLKSRKSTLALSGSFPKDITYSIQQFEPFKEWFKFKEESFKPFNSFITTINHSSKDKTIMIQPQKTNQVVLMLGTKTIPHGDIDDLALRLLACHLGSGMSSLLFKKLREEHGVAYEVGIHHPIREGETPFVLHASSSEEKALLTFQLLMESWIELSERNLSTDELILAKAKFRGQLAHNSQTTSQRAERLAHLNGIRLSETHDKNSLKEIEHMSSESLRIAANKHLKSPLLSLCGPSETLNRLSTYWEY